MENIPRKKRKIPGFHNCQKKSIELFRNTLFKLNPLSMFENFFL